MGDPSWFSWSAGPRTAKYHRTCETPCVHKAFQWLSERDRKNKRTGHGSLGSSTVVRYANVYQKAIDLAATDAVDLGRFVSETFTFDNSVGAFERFLEGRPTDVKLQITL